MGHLSSLPGALIRADKNLHDLLWHRNAIVEEQLEPGAQQSSHPPLRPNTFNSSTRIEAVWSSLGSKRKVVQFPNLTAKVQLKVLNVKLQAALLRLRVD